MKLWGRTASVILRSVRRWRRVLLTVTLLLFGTVVLGRLLIAGVPPLNQWYPKSTAVEDRQGRLLRLTRAEDGQYRLWMPLSAIDPRMAQALLLQEDRYFYYEPGCNPWSLLRGAYRSYLLGRHPQGGSTITMQLARLLWSLDTRSPWGKLRQIAYAMALELRYSKAEILEAYLNYAPFGGNVQGVGAASQIYFAHSPRRMTLPEILTLAVLPQDPALRGRIGVAGATPALLAARQRLFHRWRQQYGATASETALMGMPMPMASSRDLPFYAPWFVDQVLAERTALRQSPADAAVTQLRTSLDLSLQQLLQRQLQGYVREQGIHNIRNAAAMLVDTRDMGVRALIGSADYFNREIQGQVNGTLAKRSPGSTLKPFIYGLAFDQGVAIPATVLRDLPSAFGPYTPENFDGSFDGPVTVTQALIRSRNIPAVDVAARLHHPDFYEFLRGAGISGLAPESHYGLALVLGGGEISMQEMATLYALLANAGRLQPLQFLVQDGSQPEQSAPQLLSAEASYMVLDILRQNPPPLLADTGQGRRIPVAWKTGTSAGFRDAWTAAVFSHYVLIVWLGNFNGISNSALVGADAAAPLAFRLIDAIKASKQDLPPAIPPPPPRLRRVEVCLSSGALPTVWCPRRGQSWFIPGVSPITVDTVYRPLWVDKVSGQPVCPPYDPHRQEPRVFAYWSSALRQNFAAAGLPLALPPPSPHCANAADSLGSPPRIRSPLRGETYLLKADDGVRSPVPLSADADADVGSLYWFADSAYLGRTAAGQSLSWRPEQAGVFLLRVVDDHGRSDSRSIRIGLLP